MVRYKNNKMYFNMGYNEHYVCKWWKLQKRFFVDFFFVIVYIQAMSSPEEKAYEIMRELDVDYVLVIFGGLTGYASDG